ncbi:MAG: YveK family protein [Clostridiaceae bacterium]
MEEELELDLRDILYIIRKRMKMIVLITLTCTILSGVVSFFVLNPVYEAKTSIIVGKIQTTDQTSTQYNDVLLYQKLIKTYMEIAKSRIVAEEAYITLDFKYAVEDIQKAIQVSNQTDTQILVIKAQNGDPYEAVKLCAAVSNAFINQSKVVFPTGGDIQVMDRAKVPENPIKPNKAMNVAIAFLIGLMGSVGLAFILEFMDRTIKTEDDISRFVGIPILGIIPREGAK